MQLYAGTGCAVQLVGILQDMPVTFQKNTQMITVSRRKPANEAAIEQIEQYHVIINQRETQRILKFGFLGMWITVHGDLHLNDGTKIIADKIEFLNLSNDPQSQLVMHHREINYFKQKEQSYWYSYKNNELRKELTYIH